MEGRVTTRLRDVGVDVDFVVWLEGKTERLPRYAGIRKVNGEEYAAAIRGSAWLHQHFTDSKLISPISPEQWRRRYHLLQNFLFSALKASMSTHAATKDLTTLMRVLRRLLPPEVTSVYLQDIEHLRKQGKPFRAPEYNAQIIRGGGRQQSEETWRMRAAAEHVASKSRKPYADLAALWNECQSRTLYHPDEIQSRLRKGVSENEKMGNTVPGGYHALEFWLAIYDGEWQLAFPGRFPYSPQVPVRAGRQSAFPWPPVGEE